MKLFFAWRFSERRKRIHFLKDFSEVRVLEGKHITCISVHELVCVFHLLKWPVLKAKILAMRRLRLTWILLKEVYVFEGTL